MAYLLTFDGAQTNAAKRSVYEFVHLSLRAFSYHKDIFICVTYM